MTGETTKKKRRRPGTGQIITRGENKHLIAIFRGYKPNGTNDYFYKTFHGPKKEAEKWLREALVRRDRGEPIEDPDITFEALFNEWLDSKKNKHKPKSKEIYKETYGYYVKETFGQSQISSITARAVQKLVNGLAEGYSSSTIRLAFTVLKAPMRYALDNEMILKNPLKNIELPAKVNRSENVLRPDEALKLLDVCRTEPYGIFYAFLLWSGCRPNEAAGLCWKDVDWDGDRVAISRDITWTRRPQLTWAWDTPKNKNSYRSFTLPKSFMVQLDAYRKGQLEQRMRLGRDWCDNGMVFTNEIGEPLSPTVQNKYWKNILAKTELPEERRKMRVYDLRHSMATLLLLSGRPTKIVSARLGHSRGEVTMDTYQHVIERMQEQATDSLEEAILSGLKTVKKP